jgi:hypothetical protein
MPKDRKKSYSDYQAQAARLKKQPLKKAPADESESQASKAASVTKKKP